MANLTNQPMYQKIKEDIMHQIQTKLLARETGCLRNASSCSIIR